MPRSAPVAERRARGATLAFLLALAVTGCSQRALVGLDDLDAAPAVDYSLAPVDGPGFVDGHLHAHAVFDTVGRVYWFNADGDPALAIYVFEDMPTCSDVSTLAWLASPKVRPADVMGITLGGVRTGVYQVVDEKPPRDGNAYLLHVIDQADPILESEGISGTVTITSVKPGESVSGAFEATFSTGTLQGSFNAEPCPTGVEL